MSFPVMLLFTVGLTLCLKLIEGQLIYVNIGVFKFIVGFSVPVNVESPGHGLGWLVNIQGLYRLPDNITYFQPYKILQKRSVPNYFDRPLIYKAIENILNRKGLEGTECLYRTICELASIRYAINSKNAFSENNPASFPELERNSGEIGGGVNEYSLLTTLVHILFTPNDNVGSRYLKAHNEGYNYSYSCAENYKCNINLGQFFQTLLLESI